MSDARNAWEFFHAIGDNRSQLHQLLAQLRVLRDVALNARAIGLQFLSQPLKLIDEILDFARRGLRYPAQQRAEAVRRKIVIAGFDWTEGLPGPRQSVDIATSISDGCLISADPIGLVIFMTHSLHITQ